MTKPKKHMYRIQYIDNTYQIVDWSKTEFKAVGDSMIEGKIAVMLDEGIFRLSDVRAVVFLPPPPEKTEAEKAAEEDQALTEWGFADPDVQQWLRDHGIDISKAEGVN